MICLIDGEIKEGPGTGRDGEDVIELGTEGSRWCLCRGNGEGDDLVERLGWRINSYCYDISAAEAREILGNMQITLLENANAESRSLQQLLGNEGENNCVIRRGKRPGDPPFVQSSKDIPPHAEFMLEYGPMYRAGENVKKSAAKFWLDVVNGALSKRPIELSVDYKLKQKRLRSNKPVGRPRKRTTFGWNE